MKYVAFRIDDSTIKGGAVVQGFFVRGQRPTDLNWPLLGEFPDMEAAKAFIRSKVTDPLRQFVYGPSGYGSSL